MRTRWRVPSLGLFELGAGAIVWFAGGVLLGLIVQVVQMTVIGVARENLWLPAGIVMGIGILGIPVALLTAAASALGHVRIHEQLPDLREEYHR